ncbi:MAG TPA: rhodanese-like domain-containing protein [bacterium]|nr:rhodanese-like domain-containing protein [bacterium]
MNKKIYIVRNTFLTLATFFMFGLIIYASFSGEKNYKNLSVEEVRSRLQSDKSEYVLVDVRTEYEYTGELGHLQGALLYPIQNLDTQYHDLKSYQEQGKDIILYCRTGNRSRRAAQFLIDHGFEDIYNMEGGMRLWNQQYGRPDGSDTPPPGVQ